MNETKNHPYASGEMEITLPINADDLTENMQKFHDNVIDSKEIAKKYGDTPVTETFLTILVNTKDTSKKLFYLKVFVSDGESERTEKECELSLTPREESYFFKEALYQVTENYLNIMENSAVRPCPTDHHIHMVM